MAEKDILEKILMSHADVFADCVNTLAYRGVRTTAGGTGLRPGTCAPRPRKASTVAEGGCVISSAM